MNDEYVNKGKVVMLAAWAAVVGLMGLAWTMILATPHWQVGGMLAAMACAFSAVAAALQIRCYAVRTACLIRATAGLSRDDATAGLRGL